MSSNRKKCQFCGASIPRREERCTHCGASLDNLHLRFKVAVLGVVGFLFFCLALYFFTHYVMR